MAHALWVTRPASSPELANRRITPESPASAKGGLRRDRFKKPVGDFLKWS
jgi:hypothetical protein